MLSLTVRARTGHHTLPSRTELPTAGYVTVVASTRLGRTSDARLSGMNADACPRRKGQVPERTASTAWSSRDMTFGHHTT